MKRVIVDYKKITAHIMGLLVEKFPDGYGDSDIISFKNANYETVEAVEVRDHDTIYLVKISTHLADSILGFDINNTLEGSKDKDNNLEIAENMEEF